MANNWEKQKQKRSEELARHQKAIAMTVNIARSLHLLAGKHSYLDEVIGKFKCFQFSFRLLHIVIEEEERIVDDFSFGVSAIDDVAYLMSLFDILQRYENTHSSVQHYLLEVIVPYFFYCVEVLKEEPLWAEEPLCPFYLNLSKS